MNEKSPSHTDSSSVKSLTKFDEQLTPNTCRRALCADALYGPGGYENVILRMDTWHAANSKPRKKTLVTLYTIKTNNSKSQSENTNDRQDAVSQAVQESSENHETMMM